MKVADAISAIAFCRSSGANSTGITDRDNGKMAAAPTPSTARAAISSPTPEAYAHAAELAPNSSSATSSTFLRPSRSPSSPAGSIAAASTRLYASEIHCRSVAEACSEVAIVGRARLRTVRSSPTTSTLAAIATSAHHLRAVWSAIASTSLRQQPSNESYCQKYASPIWGRQAKGVQRPGPLLLRAELLQPAQQRRAVRGAQARRVGAVVAAGDVPEAGHVRTRRHARVQQRLDQAEPLASGLREPRDQRRPQRRDRAGPAHHLGLPAGVDLVPGDRVGVTRHV